MNVKRIKYIALTSALVASLSACATEEVVDTYVAPLSVTTIMPTIEDFQTRATTVASLEPSSRVVLMPTVSGEVEQVYVSLGDKVTVGDLICIVDNENAVDQVESMEDAVERATDAINTLTEGMLVKAPVSGYVQTIDEQLGHSVSASSQLAYLSNQKQMTVKLPFLDSFVDSSWLGDTANLSFVETGETMVGKVTEISGSPDYLYGNVAVNYVTIMVDNPGGIPVGRKVAGTVNGITCSANGEFESEANSPVMCGLNGTLDEIYVKVGDYVTAGTTMFRVTSTSTDSQLKSAQDSLADAVKARNDAYDLVGDYRVRANISGTVSNVMVKKFDMVSPSSSLIEVSTTDHMELTFTVSESVLPHLYMGQVLTIQSQGKTVYGEISELSTVASAQTGLFTVKGIILGEDVLTGTSANVEFTDFVVKNAMVVPFEAVHFIGDDAFVFKVEDNTAVKTQVQVAQFTADKIIISEGLSETDVLISSWSSQLRNGLAVNPVGSTPEIEEEPEEEVADEEEDSSDVSN